MARPLSPQLSVIPKVKTPLQLEQWAAFEALTAQRAREAAVKKQADAEAATLIGRSEGWSKAESIRAFVAATMSSIPDGADSVTLENAVKWRAWALGIADSLDPVLAQVLAFSPTQG